MKRHAKRLVCTVLAGVLLSAQLAVAAYACPLIAGGSVSLEAPVQGAAAEQDTPGTDSAPTTPATAPAQHTASEPATARASTLPHCDEALDGPAADYANLCAEHCKNGHQADRQATPDLSAISASVRPRTLVCSEPAARLARVPEPPVWRLAAGPPHAILHCCFRL